MMLDMLRQCQISLTNIFLCRARLPKEKLA